MIKRILFLVTISLICTSYGPPNCNLFKHDEACYEACQEAEKAITYSQGSKASQQHFQKSIQSCPGFDYSYYEKAVPFAKRGLIREWKVLIDEAVRLNPTEHLANRGWYHFFFMHNYEAAIQDIERLDELIDYDIGNTGDAIYHLNVMKALCWKGLGETPKAIEVLRKQLNKDDHYVGLYDYLHLGVLYLEDEQYESALQALEEQISKNDLSEIYYYKALCFKKLHRESEYKASLEKSLEYYMAGNSMSNPYRQMVDEVFLRDIENEMAMVNYSPSESLAEDSEDPMKSN